MALKESLKSEKPVEAPTRMRFAGFAEQLAGKDLSEDMARLVLAAAWTGCRRGELVALKWSDYADGELRIQRSVWHRFEKATKTEDPREIAVVEPLARVLAEQRRWLVATQHPALSTGLIFPASPRQARAGARRRGDEVSWYRSGSSLAKPLLKVCHEADVPEISPHALRRTWEKLLRLAGVDQLVRRSLAGWQSEQAQSIYTDVDRADRQAATDAVVKLVLG